MRISDWSADVCSSDLRHAAAGGGADAVPAATRVAAAARRAGAGKGRRLDGGDHRADAGAARLDGAQQRLVSRGLSVRVLRRARDRSEEHTSELQSLMRISYAVFCLKKQKKTI